MKWTVGTKIGFSFALVVAFQLVVAWGSGTRIDQQAAAAAGQLRSFQILGLLDQIRFQLTQAESAERGFVLTGQELYLAPYGTAQKALRDDLEELKGRAAGSTELEAKVVTLHALVEQKLSFAARIIELRRSLGFDAATKLVATDQGKKAMDDFEELAAAVAADQRQLLAQLKTQMDASSLATRNSVNGGVFFSILLLIGLGIWLSLNIATPLKILTAHAEKVAHGELDVPPAPGLRNDEVGLLARSFSKMVENLRRLIGEVAASVEQVVSTAGEIQAGTAQVASASSQTASAINETTATVEQVRQAAQLSAGKARGVMDDAQRVVEVSQEGLRAVEETSQAMGLIREQMVSVAQSVTQLNEKSKSIGDIIASVTSLADQSNLLAVNAAIEAARAGEAGKGFVVVAQEIKTLADQSKQATSQVRGLLNEIQGATAVSVAATEHGTRAVESGVRQAVQTGDAIRRLSRSLETSVQSSLQIAASSQQQMVGMDQVGGAMKSINQAALETVASMRQSELAAQGLNGLGRKLQSAIEQFKR